MAKGASDLSQGQNVNFGKLGAAAKTLVHFDFAVLGAGVIQDPQVRVMGGAQTAAQATEQAAAVTANGGLQFGHQISETGKIIK